MVLISPAGDEVGPPAGTPAAAIAGQSAPGVATLCAIGHKIEARAFDAILGEHRNRQASTGEVRATTRCIALELVDVKVQRG